MVRQILTIIITDRSMSSISVGIQALSRIRVEDLTIFIKSPVLVKLISVASHAIDSVVKTLLVMFIE